MLKKIIHYTHYFGITAKEVPFEDLDAYGDTQLFLDPHAIRIISGTEPYRSRAVDSIDTFLHSLTSHALSHEKDSGDLLSHISEPKETHLGLARTGYSGHAGSDFIAQQIWLALTTNLRALLEVGVLQHLEDLPLFVNGIDRDITSDITTRVIFDVLADFTHDCCSHYPELKQHGTITLAKAVWDPTQRKWIKRSYKLPTIGRKPFVLIPKGWCRKQLLGSAQRFFQIGSIGYIQQKQSRYDGDGKLLKPTKKMLEKQQSGSVRDTNLSATSTALGDNADLVEKFWKYVDEYYKTHIVKAA